MPQVPYYNDNGAPNVTPDALPIKEQTLKLDVETPQALQNAAYKQVQNAVGSATHGALSVVDALENMRERADQDRVQESLNQLLDVKHTLTLDPITGYATQLGGNVAHRQSGKMLSDEYTESFDKEAIRLMDALGNDRQRPMFAERANMLRTEYRGRLMAHEADQMHKYTVGNYQGAVAREKASAVNLWNNPDAVERSLAEIHAAHGRLGELQGLPRDVMTAATAKDVADVHIGVFDQAVSSGHENYARDYFAAYEDSMPPDAQRAIKHRLQALDFKREREAEKLANEMEREQAKAEGLSLRRDNDAQRVIEQLGNQAASGYAPKPEDLAGMYARVQGTSYETEFRRGVELIDEVQRVASKPVAEQRQYLQDVETRLRKGGATLQDQQWLGKLKTSVETGIKQLSESPVDYLITHGQTNAADTIDFSKALQSGFGDSLQRREDLLAEAGANFKTDLSGAPLSNIEREQLTGLFNAMNADQQGAALSNLRGASSPRTFQGILRQIGQDNPVLERAGEIGTLYAANYGKDIQGVMLRGLQMMKPPKDKPGDSPLMPADDEFKKVFNQYAGVYTGRDSSFAARDYQAFKAYYLGAASLKRDGFAADETTGKIALNEELLTEALHKTIGVPTVVNDVQVMRPFTLSEDEFLDKLKAACDDIERLSNGQYKADSLIDVVTLMQMESDGRYLILLGNAPLRVNGDMYGFDVFK